MKKSNRFRHWAFLLLLTFVLQIYWFMINLESKDGGAVRALAPPTSVARAEIPASKPYVGWVCCWFSPLLREVFLRVLRFSPLLKKQTFSNSNSSRNLVDEEPLKSLTSLLLLLLLLLFDIIIKSREKGKQPGDIMMHKLSFWLLLHALPAELYPPISFKKEGFSQD